MAQRVGSLRFGCRGTYGGTYPGTDAAVIGSADQPSLNCRTDTTTLEHQHTSQKPDPVSSAVQKRWAATRLQSSLCSSEELRSRCSSTFAPGLRLARRRALFAERLAPATFRPWAHRWPLTSPARGRRSLRQARSRHRVSERRRPVADVEQDEEDREDGHRPALHRASCSCSIAIAITRAGQPTASSSPPAIQRAIIPTASAFSARPSPRQQRRGGYVLAAMRGRLHGGTMRACADRC